MKKSILTIGSALMLTLAVTSCGGETKALDIKVSELETACDYVDALGKVVDEMVEIVADDEVAADEEEQFKKLIEKGDEVSAAAEDAYPREEAEKCENWEKFREKSRKLEGFM